MSATRREVVETRRCPWCEREVPVVRTGALAYHRISKTQHRVINGDKPYLDGVCDGTGHVPRH